LVSSLSHCISTWPPLGASLAAFTSHCDGRPGPTVRIDETGRRLLGLVGVEVHGQWTAGHGAGIEARRHRPRRRFWRAASGDGEDGADDKAAGDEGDMHGVRDYG